MVGALSLKAPLPQGIQSLPGSPCTCKPVPARVLKGYEGTWAGADAVEVPSGYPAEQLLTVRWWRSFLFWNWAGGWGKVAESLESSGSHAGPV